jgi:hypothetical protein
VSQLYFVFVFVFVLTRALWRCCSVKVNDAVSVLCGPDSQVFVFDRVFGVGATQAEVYEGCARRIVDDTIAGFNCTVFAFGQTGSGKTYTMQGNMNGDDEEVGGGAAAAASR